MIIPNCPVDISDVLTFQNKQSVVRGVYKQLSTVIRLNKYKIPANMISINRLLFIILISLSLNSSFSQINSVNFSQFEPRLSTLSDSVYIVNFWATWCVPCVKELPEFEKINAQYSGKKVKVF